MEKTTIYIYDSTTKRVLHSYVKETNLIEDFGVQENETITPILEERENTYQVYNDKTESWEYKPSTVYLINEQGFFIQVVDMMNIGSYKKELLIEKAPGELNSNYRFIKDTWVKVDSSNIGTFYKPTFDEKNNKYVEGASKKEIENFVDAETNKLIKTWCYEQLKNEEYYINRGLNYGKDDSEYKTYVKQKDTIISSQKKKKK